MRDRAARLTPKVRDFLVEAATFGRVYNPYTAFGENGALSPPRVRSQYGRKLPVLTIV